MVIYCLKAYVACCFVRTLPMAPLKFLLVYVSKLGFFFCLIFASHVTKVLGRELILGSQSGENVFIVHWSILWSISSHVLSKTLPFAGSIWSSSMNFYFVSRTLSSLSSHSLEKTIGVRSNLCFFLLTSLTKNPSTVKSNNFYFLIMGDDDYWLKVMLSQVLWKDDHHTFPL